MNLYAEDIEENIIGSCLLEPEALNVAASILKPEYLYSENIKTVYGAIVSLLSHNKTIDISTVCQELKKQNVLESIGGAYYVSSLTNRVASSANIEAHCRIVQQYFMLRELYKIGEKIKYKANEPQADCFDLITWTNKELSSLEDGIQTNRITSIGEIKDTLLEDMREMVRSGKPPGILTSIDLLNNQTNGWQNSNLIVIAARPGMGKTSFALDCVLTPALNQIPCAFFSLEMNKSDLAGKILSLLSSMPVQKITSKRVTTYDIDLLERDGQILNNVPLFIDDQTFSIEDLKTKARKLKRDYDIKLLCVDYLQLMKGDKHGNREAEISHISRSLKMLAKELNIPIIALSQLSRAVELRTDKKPILSDLRESGAIEQDADIVIFLFRPEYYEMSEYEMSTGVYQSAGLFVIIIAKFRGGATGEVIARWIGELTKITNYNF
jgi:replicative DNA helicase